MSNNVWQTVLTDINIIEQPTAQFIAPLTDYAAIVVKGPDAATYLQGQVSCDANQAQQQAQLGCCCNVKGRMQAIFHLFTLPAEDSEQTNYYLALPATMVESTITRLKQYAMFSKVEIASDQQVVGFGCYSPGKPPTVDNEQATIIDLGYDCYEVYLYDTQLVSLWQQLAQHYPVANSIAWHQQRIKIGLATIYPDSYEKFLPHDLNLQYVNGLNFDKGCYTGQEIISRMHYRGTLKNHMRLLSLSAAAEIKPTTPIVDESGKTVGQVVDSCRQSLLAVLRDDCLQHNLKLQEQQTLTLQLEALPYSVE